MTKSLTYKTVMASSAVGVVGIIALIAYLSMMGYVSVNNHSGDSYCAGSVESPCVAWVNFTVLKDVTITKNKNWDLVTDKSIKSYSLEVNTGKGFKVVNLSKTSLSLKKNSTIILKYTVLKNRPDETIKWSLGPVDPYFYAPILCYQETANISNSCGGLSTGNYVLSVSTAKPMIDEDWDNGAVGTRWVFVNYTVPKGFDTVVWHIKDAGGTVNLTLPSRCVSSIVRLNMTSQYIFMGTNYALWACYNESGWEVLRKYSSDNTIYEEGIFWLNTTNYYSINLSVSSGEATNIELGSEINVSVDSNSTVCLVSNHPQYSTPLCKQGEVNYTFEPDYIHEDRFNISDTLYTNKTFDFASYGYLYNFSIPSHQWDNVTSAKLDLIGYSTATGEPQNISIYINGSYSNFLYKVFNSTARVENLFNGSSEVLYGFPADTTTTVAYLKLPGIANVSSISFNISSGMVDTSFNYSWEASNKSALSFDESDLSQVITPGCSFQMCNGSRLKGHYDFEDQYDFNDFLYTNTSGCNVTRDVLEGPKFYCPTNGMNSSMTYALNGTVPTTSTAVIINVYTDSSTNYWDWPNLIVRNGNREITNINPYGGAGHYFLDTPDITTPAPWYWYCNYYAGACNFNWRTAGGRCSSVPVASSSGAVTHSINWVTTAEGEYYAQTKCSPNQPAILRTPITDFTSTANFGSTLAIVNYYYVPYWTSATIISNEINSSVPLAALNISANIYYPSNLTHAYIYVSSNNGSTWKTVENNNMVTLGTPTYLIRWKVILTTSNTSDSPVFYGINISAVQPYLKNVTVDIGEVVYNTSSEFQEYLDDQLLNRSIQLNKNYIRVLPNMNVSNSSGSAPCNNAMVDETKAYDLSYTTYASTTGNSASESYCDTPSVAYFFSNLSNTNYLITSKNTTGDCDPPFSGKYSCLLYQMYNYNTSDFENITTWQDMNMNYTNASLFVLPLNSSLIDNNGTLIRVVFASSDAASSPKLYEIRVIKNTDWSVPILINGYLSSYAKDSKGDVVIPIKVRSQTDGIINLSNLIINYTYDPNPISLNVELINKWLRASKNYSYVPITINSSGGMLDVRDLVYAKLGGNRTYNITAYIQDDPSVYSNVNFTLYSTTWEYSYPNKIYGTDYYPYSPTQKNLTPFGQTTTIPIINVTNTGHDVGLANFAIFYDKNASSTCVNITASVHNNKSSGVQLNTSWIYFQRNMTYGTKFGVWLWADLYCSYGTPVQTPFIYYRECSENVTYCSNSTYTWL